MRKYFSSHWYELAAVAALMISATLLNAQRGGQPGAAPRAAVPPPTSPVTGNAAEGKALYFSYGCYACHSYNGETGARPFVGRWGHLQDEQTFITFIRGRADVAPLVPSASMPNYSQATLSDKQAKDIYAYIRTFKSSAPPLKDIPTLNAIVEAAKREK